MITPKAEDEVRFPLVGSSDTMIQLEPLHDLIESDISVQSQLKPDGMHVLRIQLHRAGEQTEVFVERLEYLVGVTRVMGSKDRVVVFAYAGSRNKAAHLSYVVGSSHTDKATILDTVVVAIVTESLDERRDVVGIARDDL